MSQTDVTKPKDASEHPIGSQIIEFIDQVKSLDETFPLTTLAIVASGLKVKEALDSFLNEKGTPIPDKPNQFRIPSELVGRFEKLRRRQNRTRIARRAVPRSFLVSLVSHFDSFEGGLLRGLFFLRPELLNASERLLTFKDLTDFASIADARDFMVEKEIDSFLRESHVAQFEWMEKKFGLPLRKDLDAWPKFVELTERRNLFVHCNGVVSNQYLGTCKALPLDNVSKLLIGERLEVSEKYFRESYECVFELGVKLGHVLWRKLDEPTRVIADRGLNDIVIDLIRDNQYEMAQKLLDFAVGFKKFGDEESRLVFIINRAQAYKWGGDQDRALKILAEEDWTATHDRFKLALSVLKDDFAEASRMMVKLGDKGPFQKSVYLDWPMFREFKKSLEFTKAFEEVFKEPFGAYALEEALADSDQSDFKIIPQAEGQK